MLSQRVFEAADNDREFPMVNGLGFAGREEEETERQTGSVGGLGLAGIPKTSRLEPDFTRGLERQVETRQARTERDLPAPSDVREGGVVTPERPVSKREDRLQGTFKERLKKDPIFTIGLLLSDVSAGIEGRELPSVKARSRRDQGRKLELDRIGTFTDVVGTAAEAFQNATPAQQASILASTKDFGLEIGLTEDSINTFLDINFQPNTVKNTGKLLGYSPEALEKSGILELSPEQQAAEIAKPEIQAILATDTDNENRPVVTQVSKDLKDAVDTVANKTDDEIKELFGENAPEIIDFRNRGATDGGLSNDDREAFIQLTSIAGLNRHEQETLRRDTSILGDVLGLEEPRLEERREELELEEEFDVAQAEQAGQLTQEAVDKFGLRIRKPEDAPDALREFADQTTDDRAALEANTLANQIDQALLGDPLERAKRLEVQQLAAEAQEFVPTAITNTLGVGELTSGQGRRLGIAIPSDTVINDIQNQEAAARNVIRTGTELIEIIGDDPSVIGFAGATARTLNNFASQAVGVANLIPGVEITAGADDTDLLQLVVDSAGKLNDGGIAAKAVANEEIRSMVLSLALARAASQGQEGRAVSDKDVPRFINQVVGSLSEPGATRALIERTINDVDEQFRTTSRVKISREIEPFSLKLDREQLRVARKASQLAELAAQGKTPSDRQAFTAEEKRTLDEAREKFPSLDRQLRDRAAIFKDLFAFE